MNCFEWQNRSSDYLDGVLIGSVKAEADAHLESCNSCSERYRHFRLLLSSIASQPRSALPIPIRKSPFRAQLPRLDVTRTGQSRWERIPWYFRATIEASAVIVSILFAVYTGPKLRSLYARKIEASLNEFSPDSAESELLNASDPSSQAIPLQRGRSTADQSPADPNEAELSSGEGWEDESEEDAPLSLSTHSADEIRVGNSEIWRFMLKTHSPREVRSKIVTVLEGLKISPSTPGIGGIEAPGGIQFDLLLPKGVVPSLKKQLEEIAPPPPEELANSPVGETFTWYKNKSKKPVPEGQTRIVIWLSQM